MLLRHSIAFLLSGWAISADLFAQRVVHRQRPFTVQGDGLSVLAVAEAAAIAQDVWQLALERLAVDARAAKKAKFELSIFRDRKDYEAAGERTGLGLHETSPAFASSRDDAAFCHLLDETSMGGLGPLTRSLVAHEAFHVVVYEFVERGVFLPSWYVEGLSLWCEGEVAERMGWCGDKVRTAAEVDHVRRAQTLLESDAWPDAEAILYDPLDELDMLQRYSVYRMVALWQFEGPERFEQLWGVARTHGGLPSAAKALADVLRLATDDASFDTVDRQLRAWVAARSCAVERPRKPGAGGNGGDHDGTVQWLGAMDGDRWSLSATVAVPEGPQHRVDVVLAARPDGSAVRVSLYPTLGVRVVRRGPANDRVLAPWECVDEWRDELVRTGFDRPLVLQLEVRRGRLDVKVEGRRVLRVGADALAPEGGDGLGGAWGLGGIADGFPVWERIRFP